jgi:hypothetical protein
VAVSVGGAGVGVKEAGFKDPKFDWITGVGVTKRVGKGEGMGEVTHSPSVVEKFVGVGLADGVSVIVGKAVGFGMKGPGVVLETRRLYPSEPLESRKNLK